MPRGNTQPAAVKVTFPAKNVKKRHHTDTSICLNPENNSELAMTSIVNLTNLRNGTNKLPPTTVVHPIVVVNVGGMKYRALLDSGAMSHSCVRFRQIS